MLKVNPAPFMHRRNARRITTGNIEDHLNRLADCDLIIEAVVEDLPSSRTFTGGSKSTANRTPS
ncbi:MAG: hypothetical protein Ct9H300mP16_08240 [Pseudomonadota bacterium]|nr:MAG: hypothetical protein Ct9H300mP16_08240 [Pseudomonadota bacterium]